ncbi:MAG: DUF4386 domain-containing protein [Anaerolineales bacterium]|nr:DUF4386 domain-containing protein [Chloroflexota bacterium]MBL6980391.1 DUF4386 domain-containing protein [Anaerolineales bacterium]
MNINKNTPRLIGAAFLLQAVASAIVGLGLIEPLRVSGDIVATMTNFANNAILVRVGILVEMVTVTALVILSVMLYLALREQNRKVAFVALGLRLTEVALLAVSRILTFAFLSTSQAFAVEGNPAYLQTIGKILFETQNTAYSLNMIFFTLGGTIFYVLLFQSRFVPRWLATFGLIAAPLAFIGELITLMGFDVPLWVFIPNLPFELTIGLWLLIKGAKYIENA